MSSNGERYFKNEFGEYEERKDSFIASKKEVEEKLKHYFKKLLKKFEKTLHKELNWNDISVYTGISGYVLLYLYLSDNFNDDKFFQTASQLSLKSLQLMNKKRVSFLCGDPGPLVIGAVIFEKSKDYSNVDKCFFELSDIQDSVLDLKGDLPDELLYGRVGYLYALLLWEKKISSKKVDPQLIRSVISAIIESGLRLTEKRKLKVPLSFEWHNKNYFGAAHGVCGILTILLQARAYLTEVELKDFIRPTIDNLTQQIFESGNLASSEGSSSGDRLVHWCHGATGAVHLFALAYKVFGDKKYLHYAERSAQVVWGRGLLKKGYGLCHGTAGNAYALLYMYQISGDDKYLYMATQFAIWCCDFGKHGCMTADRPLSLYEGLAGTLFLLVDVLTPDEAKFPGFIL